MSKYIRKMRARFLSVGQEKSMDIRITRMSPECWVGIGGMSMKSVFTVSREDWVDREINIGCVYVYKCINFSVRA